MSQTESYFDFIGQLNKLYSLSLPSQKSISGSSNFCVRSVYTNRFTKREREKIVKCHTEENIERHY